MRIQDPAIEKVGDRRRYFRLRVTMPVVTAEGALVRRRQSVFLGWCDEMTLSEAKAQKQRILGAVNLGPVVVQSQLPFSELAQRFRETYMPRLAYSTQLNYRTALEAHLLPAFGKLRLLEIDRYAIERYFASTRLAISTKRVIKGILSSMYERAREWRLWDGDNPCQRASVGRGGSVREKRYLSPSQVAAFLAAIQGTALLPVDRARLMVETAIVSGLRISELLGLQLGDVDRSAQTVTVRRRVYRGDVDAPKTAHSARSVPVGDLAGELLAGAGRRWIFGSGEAPLLYRAVHDAILKPAAIAAGLDYPGFGCHAFRRLAATWAQEEGATPIEAMRRLGHTRLDTTMLYTLADQERAAGTSRKVLARLKPAGGVQ